MMLIVAELTFEVKIWSRLLETIDHVGAILAGAEDPIHALGRRIVSGQSLCSSPP